MIANDFPFSAVGKIIYDPTAGKAANPWWVIVECPKDILDYYHYWMKREKGIHLNKPLFGAHISVIRGEEPPKEKQQLWRNHHEKEVTFYYSPNLDTEGEYWWLDVSCPDLLSIREELGLQAEVEFGFHFTIGRELQ